MFYIVNEEAIKEDIDNEEFEDSYYEICDSDDLVTESTSYSTLCEYFALGFSFINLRMEDNSEDTFTNRLMTDFASKSTMKKGIVYGSMSIADMMGDGALDYMVTNNIEILNGHLKLNKWNKGKSTIVHLELLGKNYFIKVYTQTDSDNNDKCYIDINGVTAIRVVPFLEDDDAGTPIVCLNSVYRPCDDSLRIELLLTISLDDCNSFDNIIFSFKLDGTLLDVLCNNDKSNYDLSLIKTDIKILAKLNLLKGEI